MSLGDDKYDLFKSLLSKTGHEDFLRVQTKFRILILAFPFGTGLGAIPLGTWASRSGGVDWATFSHNFLAIPRVSYGFGYMTQLYGQEFGSVFLSIYSLMTCLFFFWLVISIAMGVTLHFRFLHRGQYETGHGGDGLNRLLVGCLVFLFAISLYFIIDFHIFPNIENPGSFRLPANRLAFLFDSICLSGIAMFGCGSTLILCWFATRNPLRP